MTIADLEKKLNAQLKQRVSTEGLIAHFSPPHRLIKQLARVEARFDALDSRHPPSSRILSAIHKLEQHDVDVLTSRDRKYLAWGLCATLEGRTHKLIFTGAGRQALTFWQQQEEISTPVYIALLFSYFAVSQAELRVDSSTWLILRDVLKDHFPKLQQQHKRPKEWMQILQEYPELLQAQPTKRLAMDFINDTHDEKIARITEKLRASSESWLWESLISQAIKTTCELQDEKFLSKIERLIHMANKYPVYKNQIMTGLLDRYASSARRNQAHELLKNASLDLWGNPQYESAMGWSNVKPETKLMVIQWFVRADLEAFFRLFGGGADERRFRYWMRFIKQISYSYILFGKNSLSFPNAEQKNFLNKNKGRFGGLARSTADNNAFVIKIGNLFVVEFSKTGNAAYIYSKKPKHTGEYYIDISWLKSGDTKIIHSGGWEHSLDHELAVRGIFPDLDSRGKKSNGYVR
jgi:hypothetical protein